MRSIVQAIASNLDVWEKQLRNYFKEDIDLRKQLKSAKENEKGLQLGVYDNSLM